MALGNIRVGEGNLHKFARTSISKLVKTAEMVRNVRVPDMLGQAMANPFEITDKEIHQKEALPLAA